MTRSARLKNSQAREGPENSPMADTSEEVLTTIPSEIQDMLAASRLSVDCKEIVSLMFKYFESKLSGTITDMRTLKGTITKLQTRVMELEEQIDAAEAYERRDTVVLSGPTVPPAQVGENCINIVQELLKTQIRLNINANDISTAHRMGNKRKKQGPDNRNMIIKLCRRSLKNEIFSACKQYKPPFYINEDLIPTRNKVLYLLRSAKKIYPNKIVSCRSFDGKIQAFLARDGMKPQKIIINSLERLDSFLKEELALPLKELEEKLQK